MSANYTITVTDSLGATATLSLFIDVTNPAIPKLIYDPVTRETYTIFDLSQSLDQILEPDILKVFDVSTSFDLEPDILLMRDLSSTSDTISGGGGGS